MIIGSIITGLLLIVFGFAIFAVAKKITDDLKLK